MTHRETKKSTKKENKKPSKPELIHEDEMKKHKTQGLINGIE
ncbi:hypothetical protein SAMN05428976_10251 [Clostridium sp. USBA 49]|jgi:hypothetical protein|nr:MULTISPECIES: hypothetical protein [Clostridium]SKA75073.1 hypothetical protein SAMN05428976_10251 [Clostridium sp. USBA 49]